ncbi:unnamed protein product [Acanthoscelides obtectus]|uniref:Tc1-like transposase DDE domain-containing protein n=1 Tax=Acanthoscelides obtectus TaxID=200917 RepID=A0A9P0PVT7_ACAOB|nr:unnamed protein product [Acanthoscelides obtectus]CAK1675500.1 hypothetical protein AOBTE_LOCUS30263 [Acanthoscelides obtectus]
MDFSLSHLHHVASGVPQGSVLGPTNPRFTYKISDHNIEAHIHHVTSKAKKLLYMLERSFKGSYVNTCAYIYRAFVRPILKFAGPVWDTVLLRDRNLVESVQRRATHRLELFNLTSFSERRLRGHLIVTFRILHGLMGTNLMHLYRLSRSNLRGHSFKLHKEPFKTTLIASKCSMIAGGLLSVFGNEAPHHNFPLCFEKMVVTFVSKAGHIATIPLNEQRTVITELRKVNPERRIILHQDNASSHTAQKTRQYLTKENVELLDHPPYSPDLSPNDFFTFLSRKLKTDSV